MQRNWLWAVSLALLATCGTGAGLGSRLSAAGANPSAVYDEAALRKTELEEARKTYEMNLQRFRAATGGVTPEDLYRWSRRWLEAQLDSVGNKQERTAALRGHLERMRDLEKRTESLAKAGQGTTADASAGKYYRTQAELWLARGRVP